MYQEDLSITGRLTIRQYTTDGTLVGETVAHNMITTKGRLLVAQLFNPKEAATQLPRVTRIHVGSGGANTEASQTQLVQDVGSVAIKEVLADQDATSRPILRLIGELGMGDCNAPLREAGLFTDGPNAVMYNRVTFDTITKSDQFKLTLIWDIKF